jgi:mitochondrial cardiolipin hydrolase
VPLRIITDNEKAFDEGSDIIRLRQAGVAVRVDQSPYHMHHKFAIFDHERLLTGSYNWTRGASEHNEENFVILGDRRLITAFNTTFERLWNRLEHQD